MSESQDPPEILRDHRMLCCQHFEPSLFSTCFKHLQQCSLCDPAEKISHPSSVIYFFSTAPLKPKLRQQMGGGSTNSKPPGPIIVMGQSETLISSRIKLITLFLHVDSVDGPFTSPADCAIMLSQAGIL
jgi:hypothetical protein